MIGTNLSSNKDFGLKVTRIPLTRPEISVEVILHFAGT